MDCANRIDGDGTSFSRGDEAAPLSSACCGVAFMAKVSAAGRAKTRLVPPLTYEEAAALNTSFLQDVADNVLTAARLAAAGAGIAGYAAYCPAGSEEFFKRILPADIGLLDASQPQFGECLLHTIAQILARGHRSAIVLNSDSPTLPTAFLVEAAAMLARPGDRAVLGPSSDGGYYLLGLKAAHRRMFEDIAWSTERVAEQTLQRARDIDLEVHRLPQWYDVDDIESLRRLYADLYGSDAHRPRSDARQPHYAAATATLMRGFWRDTEFNRKPEGRSAIERMHA
jgi:hypothetical protein